MNLRLALRLAWRDWRSGELALLLVALLVAISTVTAISLFVDRLHQALLAESVNFLAADRYIGATHPIPDHFRREAHAHGLETADTLVFPSMVFADNERHQLISVKAVSEGYPLRGALVTGDQPFGSGAVAEAIPKPGEVWMDSRLFPALDVRLGDEVEVGLAALKVSRVLLKEPDRGGSFFDLGPRLLMNLADVPATEVVQPGSRIDYRLLLRGEDETLNAFKTALDLGAGLEWVGVRESSPRIGAALDRAESFLLLGGLLAVLLAGVAVALSAHRYARRHYDHVGILKTLGVGPRGILFGFLGILGSVGLLSVALGLSLGGLLHLAIVAALDAFIPVSLPAPGPRPFLLGAATGMICALAFAMPPLLHLKDISPMRVMHRNLGAAPASEWLTWGAAVLGGLLLLIWYSESLTLTLWTLSGTAGVLLAFGALAWLLLRGGRVIGMQAGSRLRLALSGLQRRQRDSTAQILVFGLAIMLLLVLTLLRSSLIDEWRSALPEDMPNHFLMNVTPEQLVPVEALLTANTDRQGPLYPMVRGRVAAINDVEAKAWEAILQSKSSDRPVEDLSEERNLTWSAALPEENEVVAGSWWTAGDARALASLEDEYAEEFGLSLGDRLSFDIGGRRVEAQVASLRAIEWESMQPNFFIILSPGALKDFPATYMTSFFLPVDEKTFLNRLLSEFPTITVIEIDAIVEQIKSIVDRVTQAVELVLALVLVSGCLVLIASIQATRDARLGEHALLRALGGTRSLIAGSLAVEFALLGGFSGVVAAVGAEVTVALLQVQVFELPASAHPTLWLLGPVVGALLVLGVGLAGTRRLVSSPPMLVLRSVE